MGFSRLYSTQWTWGTLIGEGTGSLILVFFIVFGRNYIRSLSYSPLIKKILVGLNILVGILISTFVSIALSEIYSGSTSSATLNPINAIFYSIVVNKYEALGFILLAQLIGSFIGFLLAKLVTFKIKHEPLEKNSLKITLRSESFRFLTVLLLFLFTGFFALIDTTVYGAGTTIKVLITSIVFATLFIVMGSSSFHFFETTFTLVLETYKHFYVRKKSSESLYVIKRSLLSISYHWSSLAILVTIVFIIQAIPGSELISNRV